MGDALVDALLETPELQFVAASVAAAPSVLRAGPGIDMRRQDRLQGTRWKLGFSSGREPGTGMLPQGWGAAGSRLRWTL
jgi:hypothetical protein